MRLVLRCLIGSFSLTLVISGWILFVPPGSGIAFALLFPAFWLTSTVMGPTIATSESGPTNFITVVLASSILMSSCTRPSDVAIVRSEEHTSELQSRFDLVCRLLLEKKKQAENAAHDPT